MKIYTKKGDDGTTALFGGERLSKDDIRIEAYGSLDELNSFLGLMADQLETDKQSEIRAIQTSLFDIGAILSTAPGSKSLCDPPSLEVITSLENQIDAMESHLPTLRNFILPGGHTLVSTAHICRTVCRRAERQVVRLARGADVPSSVLVYLNRLSDYLFVFGRKLAHDLGVTEIPWISDR